MEDEWESEDFIPSPPTVAKQPLKSQWDDEGAQESWEDEEKSSHVTSALATAVHAENKENKRGVESKQKPNAKITIPEDDASKKLADKLHQLSNYGRLVEESEFQIIPEFCEKGSGKKTLESFIPKSESYFLEYAELVAQRLVIYEKSYHYLTLLKAVIWHSVKPLKAADTKELSSSLQTISREKLKVEKEAVVEKTKIGKGVKNIFLDQECELQSGDIIKQYESFGMASHVQTSIPRRIEADRYIILDINGVLLKRWDSNPHIPGVHRFGKKWIQLRLGWLEFLKQLLSHFRVGMWSTMVMRNVLKIYTFMEVQANAKLPFFMVWSKENCYQHQNIMRPNKIRVTADFKPLCYVWQHFFPSLDYKNTILVDDSPYKACMNSIYNCIFPVPFDGMNNDAYLIEVLWPYLEGLKAFGNVQEYIRENHTGQEPITSNHELYNYLECIIKDPWDSLLPSAPIKKLSIEDALLHHHQRDEQFTSLYKELDSLQLETLLLLKSSRRQWTRGELICFAIYLGLPRTDFSENVAIGYIQNLIERMGKERLLVEPSVGK